jgi:hypothetical protein
MSVLEVGDDTDVSFGGAMLAASELTGGAAADVDDELAAGAVPPAVELSEVEGSEAAAG